MRTTSPTLLLPLLAACSSTPIGERHAEFLEREYAPFAREGDASIQGQAFLRTRGGDVKLGAGNHVWLTPATSYSREWYEREVVAGERLAPPDPRASRHARRTLADADGRFRFDALPPGEYYVTCRIEWDVVSYWGRLERTGGTAHAHVQLGRGERAPAIVTRPCPTSDLDAEDSSDGWGFLQRGEHTCP